MYGYHPFFWKIVHSPKLGAEICFPFALPLAYKYMEVELWPKKYGTNSRCYGECLEEHFGNMMRTHGELNENTLGTEKKSPPLPP